MPEQPAGPKKMHNQEGGPNFNQQEQVVSGRQANIGSIHGTIEFGDKTINQGGIHYYNEPRALDLIPLNPRIKIKNFLINYLGTRSQPVPFGGRDSELASLEKWRQESDKSFLLLASPAGCGKSALLVRWSALLSSPAFAEEVAVIFVPISARFNTNLPDVVWPCVAAQLAQLLGKEIPENYLNAGPDQWQNLAGYYLSDGLPDGRQLLLILDSLDEAAWEIGSDFLPIDLPPSTKVAVSARYLAGEKPGPEPWLRILGWERFNLAETQSLDFLKPEGVHDILNKMGKPLNELEEGIEEELFRLTGGDPLLVELYVADLWAQGAQKARLRKRDLPNLRPGYEGYLQNWWRDQSKLWGDDRPLEERTTVNFLAILAQALGPLTLADVKALFPPDEAAQKPQIDRAVGYLRRFVMGDGRDYGYVLSHPKLATYITNEILDEEKSAEARESFLAWGRRTLAELRGGDETGFDSTAPYLLQYYGRHLQKSAGPVDDYLTLVSWEWLQSWYRYSGNYVGFLRDVDLVRERVVGTNREAAAVGSQAPYLGEEVRCMLCQASVSSLAGNLPYDLLIALQLFNIWTDEQSLFFARRRSIEERMDALFDLAPHLEEKNRVATYREILNGALNQKYDFNIEKWLIRLARHLPEEVYTATGGMTGLFQRSRILVALAPYLPDKILAEARKRENRIGSTAILCALAPFVPEEVLAESLHQTFVDRAQILKALSGALPRKMVEDLAWKLYQETDQNGLLRVKAQVLAIIAAVLPEDYSALAQQTVQEMLATDSPDLWMRELLQLAEFFPSGGREEIFDIVFNESGATIGYWLGRRRDVLGEAARFMPERLMAEAKIQQDLHDKADFLELLAPYSPQEVLLASRDLDIDFLRIAILELLAPILPQEVFEEGQELVRDVFFHYPEIGPVLIALAPFLPDQILAFDLKALSSTRKLDIYCALAPYRPRQILEIILTLEAKEQVKPITALAPYLPKAMRTALLTKALQLTFLQNGIESWFDFFDKWSAEHPQAVSKVIHSIPNNIIGDFLLLALVEHFPQEVLLEFSRIRNTLIQVMVLEELAGKIPGDRLAQAAIETLTAVRHLNITSWRRSMRDDLSRYIAADDLSRGDLFVKDAEILRLDMVVSLIPALPESEKSLLADELVRKVRSIGDEAERAQLLVKLAAHIPELIFAEMKTLENETDRSLVLKALAPYLSDQILIEARRLENKSIYASVLAELAPYQPSAVLRAARELQPDHVKVLAKLAPIIPDEIFLEVQKVDQESDQALILAEMGPDQSKKVFDLAQGMSEEFYKTQLLIKLAPVMADEVLEVPVKKSSNRTRVLIALAMFRPLEVMAKQAEEEIQDFDLTKALAVRVPEKIWPQVQQLTEINEWLAVTAEIAPYLAKKPIGELYPIWEKFVRALNRKKRVETIDLVAQMGPVIAALGGERAIEQTLTAVADVCQWWP